VKTYLIEDNVEVVLSLSEAAIIRDALEGSLSAVRRPVVEQLQRWLSVALSLRNEEKHESH